LSVLVATLGANSELSAAFSTRLGR